MEDVFLSNFRPFPFIHHYILTHVFVFIHTICLIYCSFLTICCRFVEQFYSFSLFLMCLCAFLIIA